MMKLLSNPLSPYGRKVKIAMAMKGLKDRIEIVHVDTNPADNPEINTRQSAGARSRRCVIDDNTAIFDSHVICEYLDSLAPSPVLFPKSGVERIKTLTLGSLGRRHPRCGAAAGLREALPARGDMARALAGAPAGQDRPGASIIWRRRRRPGARAPTTAT